MLVEALLRQLSSRSDVELRFTPEDAAAEIAPWLRGGWVARPQGAGGLGQRLETAFAEAFALGNQRIVVIGSMPRPFRSNCFGSPNWAGRPPMTSSGFSNGTSNALPWGMGLRKPITRG